MAVAVHTLDLSAPPRAGFWKRYVLPLPPEQSNGVWHVSPAIDMAAYHFSWVWVLVPLILTTHYRHVIEIYAVMMGANLAHRHFGLPYAYFDNGVFRSFKRRLTWFPLTCVALLAATPLLLSRHIGGPIGIGAVGAVVFFSLLWNFWHTYMQKFGILRLYLVKDPTASELKTPKWVDKYFLLCWIPLYLTYVGPANKYLVLANGHEVEGFTSVILAFMERYEAWLVLPSALIAAGGVGLWLWHEWRSHRFKNFARLSAGTGTLLISTALLWANPVKAFIAFAFSHAAEYMVFVWAFQRRRYCRPRPEASLMQRLLRYPKVWYLSLVVLLGAAGALQVLYSYYLGHRVKGITFLGLTGASWFFYYAVYESLVHFYMDTFMWKMRRAEVRESI